MSRFHEFMRISVEGDSLFAAIFSKFVETITISSIQMATKCTLLTESIQKHLFDEQIKDKL